MEKKAVIWVSTVLYILITIAVLSIAFAALKPRIDEMRDKAIIEQSIDMMGKIDETISQVQDTPGTRREVQINLKKGSLIFDCADKNIIWEFDSVTKYSEVGKEIDNGNIKIKTSDKAGASGVWTVTLTLAYETEITFNGEALTTPKTINSAELPFTLFIENVASVINIKTS